MLDDSPRFKMIELGETASTNSFLQGYKPLRPVDITLVTAEHQTAGRGQGTNHWESEPGKNLLFSLLLHPTALPATELFVLSEAIALSIREAIVKVFSQEEVTVKWPNDIYVGDRKIAGILIENELQGMNIQRAIIGCGVDINQEEFAFPSSPSAEHHPTPVSLFMLLGHETERRFVLEDIITAFTRRYEAIQSGNIQARAAIHDDYLKVLYRRNGLHPFQEVLPQGSASQASNAHGQDASNAKPSVSTTFLAEIADVEPSGHLVLRDTNGNLHRYAFKEVRFLQDPSNM